SARTSHPALRSAHSLARRTSVPPTRVRPAVRHERRAHRGELGPGARARHRHRRGVRRRGDGRRCDHRAARSDRRAARTSDRRCVMSTDYVTDGMPETEPVDAEGYLRISSAEDELGVGRQRTELSGAFGAAERAVRWTTENDRSAFRGKVRPGFRALLDRLDAPSGAPELWAWHSDRITRTPKELELL